MAAQKREKEETELKVPESIPLCSPTLPVPSPSTPPPQSATTTHISVAVISDPKRSDRSATESVDLKVSSMDDQPRSTSAASPESTDLVGGKAKLQALKPCKVTLSNLKFFFFKNSLLAFKVHVPLAIVGNRLTSMDDQPRSTSAASPESTDLVGGKTKLQALKPC